MIAGVEVAVATVPAKPLALVTLTLVTVPTLMAAVSQSASIGTPGSDFEAWMAFLGAVELPGGLRRDGWTHSSASAGTVTVMADLHDEER